MNTNGRTSIILASLALPLTVLISGTIAWVLKSTNPDNVDVTAGLAYLRPILLSALITFAITMLAAFMFAIRGKRLDKSPELGTLGLLLVVVLTLLSIAAGIANKGAGDAEDAYREEKARVFFEALEKQDR